MVVTPSKLRENIYRILDQILKTGQPVEILRGGKILKIIATEPVSKLARLQKRTISVGHPDDLITIDWSKKWKPSL